MKHLVNTAVIVLLFCSQRAQAQGLSEYQGYIKKHFPAWVKHYNIKSMDDWESSSNSVIEATKAQRRNDWNIYHKNYLPFLYFSPEKTHFIDLFSAGIEIKKVGNKYKGFADVDQAVLLGNSKDKTTKQLTFCGSICSFQEASWVNNNLAIIVGNYNDENGNYLPYLGLIDFKKASIKIYLGKLQIETITNGYVGELFKKIDFE